MYSSNQCAPLLVLPFPHNFVHWNIANASVHHISRSQIPIWERILVETPFRVRYVFLQSVRTSISPSIPS